MNDVASYDPAQLLAKYLPSDSLDRYYELLMAENQCVNLVSRETSRSDFDRLVCESLYPLELLSGVYCRYLDIGSGGGLPALPVILSGAGREESVLMERTAKKAAALRRIACGLDLAPRVEARNYEEVKFDRLFDLITLRYVRLTPVLLKRVMNDLSPHGVFVYYSSPDFSATSYNRETHAFRSPQDGVIKSVTVFSHTR